MACSSAKCEVLPFVLFTCAAQTLLSYQGNIRVCMEDDGSSIGDDVMDSIIGTNEKIGTLMLLKQGELWSPGLCYFKMFCNISDSWFTGL